LNNGEQNTAEKSNVSTPRTQLKFWGASKG